MTQLIANSNRTQEIETLVQADSSPFQPSPGHEPLGPSHLDAPSPAPSPTPSPKVEDLSQIQRDDPTGSTPFLPPTLETRKKKKKTETTSHVDEIPSWQSPKILDGGEERPLKSGSKRKFSPDEDGALSDGPPESDEFQFSRPIQSPKKSVEVADLGNQGRSPTKTPVSIRRGTGTGNAKRKVLEPSKISPSPLQYDYLECLCFNLRCTESTNLNLNSPNKARAFLHADNKISQPIGANENTVFPQKSKSIEAIKGKSLNRAARRPFSSINAQADKHPRPSNGVDQQLRQTSVGVSRESPMTQSEPMGIVPDESSTSRTSRRRGAVVSYAEPNLRDKMRRPTKELIDAVGKNGARRSSSFQLEVLGETSDVSSKGQSATSPCPAVSSAEMSLASQSMDSSSTEVAPHQLLETVSRRRQSRRHSSNPKSTTREPSPPREVQGAAELQSLRKSPEQTSSLMHVDGSFDAENSGMWDSSADVNYRRETRVAARRRSMMV